MFRVRKEKIINGQQIMRLGADNWPLIITPQLITQIRRR